MAHNIDVCRCCVSRFEKQLEIADPRLLLALVPKFRNFLRLVKDENKVMDLLVKAAEREYPDAEIAILRCPDISRFFRVFVENDC